MLTHIKNRVLLETRVTPRDANVICADVIALSHNCVAVIDGSTGKPWHAPGQPSAAVVAKKIAEVLNNLGKRDAMEDVVLRASQALADLKAANQTGPLIGPCATFAAAHLARREVWRVGDCLVRIGSNIYPPQMWPDEVISSARALILRSSLAEGGLTTADLLLNDHGRKAVMPLLRASEGLRNRDVVGGYGALDGTLVPSKYLERWTVAKGEEVVLATDGYLDVSGSLKDAEAHLRAIIEKDPLLIGNYPKTKACVTGANSFDDRAFIRFIMP